MKSSSIVRVLIVVFISLQLLVSSTAVLSCDYKPKGRERPSDSVEDPDLVSIIEDIKTLKEKIKDSPRSSWKRPSHIRKFVMCIKLNVLKKQVARNDLETAYDKMVDDIKPKLTKFWVTNEDLQAEFCVDCDNILTKIEAAMTPDIDPPVILLTPDQTVLDGDAIGGIIIEWEITDDSGILDATVELNGETIASYSGPTSISDSYLLANTPGDYLFEITATDLNGLVSSMQSTISITDDDTTAPTITIIYVGSGTDLDPGYWYVSVEDFESGIDEVLMVLNGYEIIHDFHNGISSYIYEVPTPKSIGVTTLEVIVTNNDNDWDGDQEITTEEDTVEIIHDPSPPPPPIP